MTTAPEFRVPTQIPSEDLRFDTSNPRLAAEYPLPEDASDVAVIKALKDIADLGELLSSISSNGYVNIEPMIIIGDDAPFRVLEGNRRLAAIKLFLQAGLAEECSIVLPSISNVKLSTLHNLLVYRVESEDESRAFIGFKHINGPHRWDSLAKAKYAAKWYSRGSITVSQISKQLGDSHNTVLKMLHGIFVLDQAENNDLFKIADKYPGRQFAFSHLYTALTRKQYRIYLGLTPTLTSEGLSVNPIPEGNFRQLEQLLKWLYGSKSENILPVIESQNPDLKYLAEVISNESALSIFEERRDLRAAHASLAPADTVFRRSLAKAQISTKECLSNVQEYDGNETLLELAHNLKKSADALYEFMNNRSNN